jgi:hypothetical protein
VINAGKPVFTATEREPSKSRRENSAMEPAIVSHFGNMAKKSHDFDDIKAGPASH